MKNDTSFPLRRALIPLAILVGFAVLMGGILLLASGFSPITPETEIPDVRLNEMMAKNRSVPDKNGNLYDWVELYNPGKTDADVSGLRLSFSLLQPGAEIPKGSVVPAGGYLVLFLTGSEKTGVALKLNKAGGETLYLTDAKGAKKLDEVQTRELKSDQVLAKNAETGIWEVREDYTPGFANTDEGRAAYESSRIGGDDALKITELMAKNHFSAWDAFEETSDWIELCNTGSEPLNLSDYRISDKGDAFADRLPERILQPGEIVLLWASGRDRITDSGEIHLNFRLSEYGDSVFLFSKDGKRLQTVTYRELPANYSYARRPDGTFEQTDLPTPGFANTSDGLEEYFRAFDEERNGLIFSELMTCNTKYLPQNGKSYYDWVELYNNTDHEILLSDYFISTSASARRMYRLPSRTLGAGERIILFCSGDEKLSSKAYAHLPFKLDAKGEELYLTHDDGTAADAVWLRNIPANTTYGRAPGKNGFFYLTSPTPGTANTDGLRFVAEKPQASVRSGVFNGVESVSVELTAPYGFRIYYTVDGSDPNKFSALYTAPLTLTKTSVIRAICFAEGGLPSRTATFSYILNENHTFPIISMVTDPDNLWSEERGICANGKGYTEQYPHFGANFWKDWERDASLTLFETDGSIGFSEDCGISMFGHFGRGEAKKPFKINFRECYGVGKLHYNLFEGNPDFTSYNSFVLRAGSQDQRRAKMRDELFSDIVSQATELITQAYRPVILYLNGKYWGVYFIREKIGAEMLSHRLGVSEESIDLLYRSGTTEVGKNSSWRAIQNYLKTHDPSLPETYLYLAERIDLDSIIDFKISQAFTANYDIHNVRFYRSSETDGKWRWLMYDQDYAFITKEEAVNHSLQDADAKATNELIRALLMHEDFRKRYLQRWADLLQNGYSTKTVTEAIDRMEVLLKGEMQRDNERWGVEQKQWASMVNYLRSFARAWTKQVIQQLRESPELALTEEEYTLYFASIK